jgi:hypothetical protein
MLHSPAVAQAPGPTAAATSLVALAVLLLAAGAGAGIGHGARGPTPGALPLECRLGDGPWQACWMEVIEVGRHWVLRVGPRQLEFQHDGRGGVRMQRDGGPWRPVTARWQAPRDLCWDGLCARGEIPLD